MPSHPGAPQSAGMSERKVSLSRSPLVAGLEDVQLVRLSRAFQRRLGCAVNEDVFLECPYAFAPRREVLDVARQADSPLRHLVEKIAAYAAPDVLLGYASDRIMADESGDFAVYLTEEARDAVIRQNRAISKELWRRVREEIGKSPGGWRELGSAGELEQGFVKATRPRHEIELALPVVELRRRRPLKNRPPGRARDGYVELTPLYEDFENVRYAVVPQATQTHLPSKHAEAQTYPGHPKNQWTQYEFEIDEGIVEIWNGKEAEENQEENGAENDTENGSETKEEEEISEEELQLREIRRKAWDNLNQFLKSRAPDILDAVSFNATTNLYTNDVVNLAKAGQVAAFTQPYSDYDERISLIDLKTVGRMHLLSASWHCDLDDIIACTYLNKESKDSSLVALWSLVSPLRPKFLLDCEERLSMLSFCPLAGYTNVLVGGCLDGKVIVWEVNKQFFEKDEEVDSFEYESKEPELKECKIAVSAEKSQRGSITNLQWLPSWCHIESDGNYHRASSDSPRDQRAQFATTSSDGSVFFWSLPRTLSRPAQMRSPLHLTTSPVYQLRLEESVALTSLCLPLAVSEESSTLSIRDQADLDRLRRIFLGTSLGEVLCCTWEGQTFSVDVTDRETCTVTSRYCAHDGLVRAMVRSPHLDDVFLTVGGRRFALWKEDFAEAPIFQRASTSCSRYADACWSMGRPGTFILARLDGYIELWDLKRRADEPVLLQTVSGKSAQFLIPSPPSNPNRLLAVLDGISTVRVLVEPRGTNEEDLERLEWCEEFAWRETKRKLDFRRWQEEYLRTHPTALRRKAEREQAEVNRRHREARERFLKEQEAQAREEAARRLARRRVSKSVLWRRGELRRAEEILLAKKGFVPAELEEKRRPLVELEAQRRVNRQKTRELLGRADDMLDRCIAREVPEIRRREPQPESTADADRGGPVGECKAADREKLEEEYRKLCEEMKEKMKREPYRPKIRWRSTMTAVLRKVLGIICMACSSPLHGAGGWFVFVSVTAFIMTLIWCILYLFSIREALKLPINWILTELINTGIYTVLYLTAFIAQLAWAGFAPSIVAGVFGLFNTIAYGLGTYFLLLEHKNSQQ